MTFDQLLAFLIIVGGLYSLLEVARLRWRGISEGLIQRKSRSRETLLAAGVAAIPVATTAGATYFWGHSLATLESTGASWAPIILWLVGVGAPCLALYTSAVRGLRGYAAVARDSGSSDRR